MSFVCIVKSAGHEVPDSPLQDTAWQEYSTLAAPAPDTDVSAKPDNLPFVAAAGVFLFKADNITQSYLYDHIIHATGFDRWWLISVRSVSAALRAAAAKSLPREA